MQSIWEPPQPLKMNAPRGGTIVFYNIIVDIYLIVIVWYNKLMIYNKNCFV